MPALDRSRPAPVPALDLGGTYLRRAVVDADGRLAAPCVKTFDPDGVIAGGGIAMAWREWSLGPAPEAVAAYASRVQAPRKRIVPAASGDDVGLVGALSLVASGI